MTSLYHPDFSESLDNVYYSLTMFPYPSGYGLHVGHASTFIINDVNARFRRMRGEVVFNPIGFDSFGLPTENYAIKVGKPAHEVTQDNINNFLRQINALDLSFDMERTVVTSDPSYYQWTQWLFHELFDAGLIYRDEQFVNRCPGCQTVIANDQVTEGTCERCKATIEQKLMPQWFVKTTAYADELIQGLDDLDRPEHTKQMQRNWIGRSEGAYVTFHVSEERFIEIYTTRVDTIYGVTAIVLAPENTSLDDMIDEDHMKNLEVYRSQTRAKTAVERQQGHDKKTGVDSGLTAFHPLTHEYIPVWFADFVLPDYATGSVMLVPAHDARDRLFAQSHGIGYTTVLDGEIADGQSVVREGKLIHSGDFDGLPHTDAQHAIIDYLDEHDIGRRAVTYRLRDWSISRQRYRGCPIPVYYDDEAISLGDPHEDEVPKDAVVVLVRNPDTGEYLTTNRSPSKGSRLFVYGDREGEETYLQSAYRHVLLDTGYDQLELVDWVNNVNFHYVSHSGESRSMRVCAFLMEIESDYRSVDWTPYADRFVPERVSPSDLPDVITGDLHTYVYELLGSKRLERKQIPHLVPRDQLPVQLPLDLDEYQPAGISPLAQHPTFSYYQQGAMLYRRECDTLDASMCSSFYYLRYPDSANQHELISPHLRDVMMPIELYIGGKEHTVGHLLYARFVMRFLYHQDYVSTPEPFSQLIHQGMLQGEDGRKMSKRRGNVIDPLDVVEEYGADVLRLYLLFMGPVEQDKDRDTSTLQGVARFVKRVERLYHDGSCMQSDDYLSANDDSREASNLQVEKALHTAIQGVTQDLEQFKYNTVVSKLMVLVNEIYSAGVVHKEQFSVLMQLLAPLTPALAEKYRLMLGQSDSIHMSAWPTYDPSVLIEDEVTIAIQVNGKMRGTIDVVRDMSQDDVLVQAHQIPSIAKYIEGGEIARVIFVPNKIINIIIT